jgi:hypothetical protein
MLKNVLIGLLATTTVIPMFGKEKIDPTNYPETATVTSAKIVTVETGATVTRNPACDNPQTSFMRGFCSTAGTHIANTEKRYVEVTASIGNNIYTMAGNKLPPPGNYRARFLNNGKIELMGPNPKGELHAHEFSVIAIEAQK